MTGRTSTVSVDGARVSPADRARAEADRQHIAAQQRQAARVVAGAALDVGDARLLLSILGLDAAVVQAARHERVGGRASRRRGARVAA